MMSQKRRKQLIVVQLTLICATLIALFAYHGHFMRSFHQAALRIHPQQCNVPHSNDTTCLALHRRGCARRIAVVGNGPITEAQREEINTQYDAVLRFTTLNNWVCGDALTVWLLEHSSGTKLHTDSSAYLGLGQLPLCTTQKAGTAARNVWFVGGQGTDGAQGRHLVGAYPWLSSTPSVVLDAEKWRALYRNVVSDGTPTIGWIGMMAALSCAPRGVGSVALYGFNWKATGQQVFRHNLLAEKSFADVLDGAGHVTVHATPCDNQWMCHGCIISPTNGSTCIETRHQSQGDATRDALLRTNQAARDAEVENVEVRALQELEVLTGGAASTASATAAKTTALADRSTGRPVKG